MSPGRILYHAAQAGKGEAKTLRLTLVDPVADEAVFALHGVSGLRRFRLARLAREAEEQGHLLSYEDLRSLLLTSVATIKRDVAAIEARMGEQVALRGRRNGGGGNDAAGSTGRTGSGMTGEAGA